MHWCVNTLHHAHHLIPLVPAVVATAATAQGKGRSAAAGLTTRWEFAACVTPLAGMCSETNDPGSVALEDETVNWYAAADYRLSGNWILRAVYGQGRSRMGESVNGVLVSRYTTWEFLMGNTMLSNYRCDPVSTGYALHHLVLNASYILRPYRDRRYIGISFRLTGGLHVLGVHAERGVVAGHTYQTECSEFWGSALGWDTRTAGGEEALFC